MPWPWASESICQLRPPVVIHYVGVLFLVVALHRAGDLFDTEIVNLRAGDNRWPIGPTVSNQIIIKYNYFHGNVIITKAIGSSHFSRYQPRVIVAIVNVYVYTTQCDAIRTFRRMSFDWLAFFFVYHVAVCVIVT